MFRLSDRTVALVLLSGLLVVDLCQCQDSTGLIEEIAVNVSRIASSMANRIINCEGHIINPSNTSSTCGKDVVPYHNTTEMSIEVLFNWKAESGVDTRCFCSAAALSLLLSNSNPALVLSSYVCDNENENATIYCAEPCISTADNEVSCKENPDCSNPDDKLMCFSYGKKAHLLPNQWQVYLLISGIGCDTISDHATELCDILFETSSPTASQPSSTPEDDLGTVAIVSLTFGVFAGVFITSVCTAIILICLYCTLRVKRRHKINSQELQTITCTNIAYNHSSKVQFYGEKPTIATVIDSVNKFANCVIPYSAIKIVCELGEGAFGVVYKGKLLQGNHSEAEDVAIKTLKEHSSIEQVKEFVSESEMMLFLDHPNVLKLLGVCFDTEDQLPAIILPFMANGDLKSFLIEKRGQNEPNVLPESLSMTDLVSMCMDIARGMDYLTEQKFVHRDLAARNCMVDEKLSVKVADFGFSRDIYNRDYYRLQRRTMLPVKWLPPESLHDNIYDEKTDVWSYGVVLWEIYSLGRGPYPGVDNADIPDYISAGNRLKQPALCPQIIYTLMNECWSHVPKERPKFSKIIETFTLAEQEDLTALPTNDNDRFYFVLESV